MTGRLNGRRLVLDNGKTLYGLNDSGKTLSAHLFPIRANNGFNLRASPTIFGRAFGRKINVLSDRNGLND